MSASTYVPAIWDVVASNLSASSVLAAPLTTSSTSPLKPARWMMEATSMSPVSPIAIIVTSALVREERYRIGAAVAPADVSATGAQRTAGAGAAAAGGVATAAIAASGVAYGTTGDRGGGNSGVDHDGRLVRCHPNVQDGSADPERSRHGEPGAAFDP